MQTTHVVTVFLRRKDDRILLLRRSQQVGSYRGCWAGVSGYLEEPLPLQQALKELREETGIEAQDVRLRVEAPMLEVRDGQLQRCWCVHPFLFDLIDPVDVTLDWEHETCRWVTPEEIATLETVPLLAEAFRRCLQQEQVGS